MDIVLANELIETLQKIVAEHGNLPICFDFDSEYSNGYVSHFDLLNIEVKNDNINHIDKVIRIPC